MVNNGRNYPSNKIKRKSAKILSLERFQVNFFAFLSKAVKGVKINAVELIGEMGLCVEDAWCFPGNKSLIL